MSLARPAMMNFLGLFYACLSQNSLEIEKTPNLKDFKTHGVLCDSQRRGTVILTIQAECKFTCCVTVHVINGDVLCGFRGICPAFKGVVKKRGTIINTDSMKLLQSRSIMFFKWNHFFVVFQSNQ